MKKDGKYAVVGLPCHIEGIRKAEMNIPKLRKRIVLHIGLVCNHTPSFLATEHLLKSRGIRKENVKSIRYRGEGWPGKMRIETDDNVHMIPLQDYWNSDFGRKFKSERCSLCKDLFCELADISCADAWLKEYSSDDQGTSIFVVRSKRMDDFLNHDEKIQMKKINSSRVIISQLESVRKRKNKYLFFVYVIENKVSELLKS
jgi:coenzyme F420 hydrogenase subunit beta